jgi:serine/threonine-protein phosphatase 2B catalytic subunit
MKSKIRYNHIRDCSIIYGAELVNGFLKKNNLLSIIRGHEVFLDGYKFHQWNKNNYDPPSVITVFSAPNYCGISSNKAAILKINK